MMEGAYNAIRANLCKRPLLALGKPLEQVKLRVVHDVRRVGFGNARGGLFYWGFWYADFVGELESVPLVERG